MTLATFVSSLPKKIYKILPLFEDARCGKQVFLSEYIDSLLIELRGAFETFPEMTESEMYISVVNTVHYFHAYVDSMSLTVCRREVFKMMSMLRQMEGCVQSG